MMIIDTNKPIKRIKKKIGRPSTGQTPKKHLTVIGTPDEIDYINSFIFSRGYSTKSRFIVENLIALFKETEELEKQNNG